MRRITLLALAGCLVLMASCSRSNNLFFGEVEAAVGNHTVRVTDCYRTEVPQPQQIVDAGTGAVSYQFTPCRDADVLIRDEELIVNGQSYGVLAAGNTVTVDHGKVLIDEVEAHAAPR
ncbi:MAG: hypothetical protein KDI12_15555 [Anaerolineae bacterium]|nr:hypothetical protein [Anaerolineae bacterium]